MKIEQPLCVPDTGTEHTTFSLWLVEVGEEVTAFDRVAEFLIPGAVIDVVAGVGGTLRKRLALPGDCLATGAIFGVIEMEESS